ncbi:hypothetical protein [Mycobacterium sp.]|jgi:hypothetical protein|uniref:hypothetical protein n=1 Tax=Mycobacterium sp. TaxID=1785 RepID=UPI002CA9CA78|nr:hypothetical protein [Mycobacterium sp.]HTH88103.1 hypothetical protein [Mycobacterium sp.]
MNFRRRSWLLAATVVIAIGGSAALFLPTTQHTAPAAYQIDIARLPGLKDSLAATFAVEMQPTQTVTQDNVDKFTAALNALTVTPPECLNAAAANFGQTVGTVVTSLSAENKQFGVVIKAAESPRPFVTSAPVDACRTFDAERPDGAVSRTRVIDAPPVADAATSATHSIQTGGLAGDRVVDQYDYIAVLDDRHMVMVTSFANPTDTQAVGEQVARLLADAVNAVRWR